MKGIVRDFKLADKDLKYYCIFMYLKANMNIMKREIKNILKKPNKAFRDLKKYVK